MDGSSPFSVSLGGSSRQLSPVAREFCLKGPVPTVADPTGGSSRPLLAGASEFHPATYPPGKLSVTLEPPSPDDFGRVVGKGFSQALAICAKVGNGANVSRVGTHTLLLTANTTEALKMLHEAMVLHIKTLCIKAIKPRVFKENINCEQAGVFSLTVGSKFVETNAMCKMVGNGARIERLITGGPELMLQADTQEALNMLKGLLIARIARVKASQNIGSRVKKEASWKPLFDEPPSPISAGGRSVVRHIVVYNIDVFVNAGHVANKNDPTLRVSTRNLVGLLEASTGIRTVIGKRLVIGAESFPATNSYMAEGYGQGKTEDVMCIVSNHNGSVSETLVIAACDGSEDIAYFAAWCGMRVEVWSWKNARSPNFDAVAQHFSDGRVKLVELDAHVGRLIFKTAPLPDTRTKEAAQAAITAMLLESANKCDCGRVKCVPTSCLCLCHGGGGAGGSERSFLKVPKADVREAPSMCEVSPNAAGETPSMREVSPNAAGGGASLSVTRLVCSCEETECYGTVENCDCFCHVLLKELREEVRINEPMTIAALCNRFPRKPNLSHAVSHGITVVYNYDDILVEARKAGLYVQVGATAGKTLVYFTKPSSSVISPTRPSPFHPELIKAAEKAKLPLLVWLQLPENADLRELHLKRQRFHLELINEIFVNESMTIAQLESRFPKKANDTYEYTNILTEVHAAGLHVVLDEAGFPQRVVYCSCEGGCERTRTGGPYCSA